MNRTQWEIVGVVFGFTFSIPGMGEIFLQYLAPIILKENANPSTHILIALIYTLVFLASFSGVFVIIRNIQKKLNISRSQNEFDKYMIKNVLTLFISILIALILKSRLSL